MRIFEELSLYYWQKRKRKKVVFSGWQDKSAVSVGEQLRKLRISLKLWDIYKYYFLDKVENRALRIKFVKLPSLYGLRKLITQYIQKRENTNRMG